LRNVAYQVGSGGENAMDENILRVTIRAPRCGNRAEWCGMEADAIGFVRVLFEAGLV
jgi:hypothetical protein